MKKVMFVGMGAIGASFASQMKDNGVDPLVLCGSDRKARYSNKGFIVNKKRYDYEYVTPEEKNVNVDLIIIVVKYHNLEEVVSQIENFVGENTLIMSLMNGIDSELIIGKKYGMEHLVHAFVVSLDGVRTHNSIEYSSPGQIIFGNQNGIEDFKTDLIKEILIASNISYQISPEILKRLWWKFMVNVGANQISSILNATYGTLKSSKEAQSLMRMAMLEVVELSKAMHVNLDISSIEQFYEMIKNLGDDGKTSMLQDVHAKRKTEVEMLAGQVIAYGKEYNIPTPVNDLLFKMIKVIEYQYDH